MQDNLPICEAWVLNVDDSESVRYVRHRVMSQAGFCVEDAATAAEALRIVQQKRPDVVLLDVHLPDADGFEVCRRIRQSAAGEHIAIVHVTAEAADAGSQRTGLESGADAYLTEPVDPGVLVATVRALLRARAAEAELQLALEHTTDDVVILDRDWRITYMNDRARQAVAGGRNMVGQLHWDAFPGSAGTLVEQQYRAAVRTNTPVHFDYYYEPLRAWFEIHAYPDRSRLIVYFRDITERKRIEIEREKLIESLRESEFHARRRLAELEALYESAPIGLCVVDTELRYVRVNRTLAEMNGAPVQAHLGRTPSEVIPGVAEQVEVLLRRVLESGEPVLNAEIRGEPPHLSGEKVVNLRYVPLHDEHGAVVGISAAVEDITERKQAEERLRASEERYRAVIEQASEAFFLHDVQGKFVDVNQRACETLGYSREELLSLTVLDVEQDLTPEKARELWDRVQPGKGFTLYGHHRRKDGSQFPIEARVSALTIGGQRLFLALIRDITDRLRIEQALRESEQVYRAVFERAAIGMGRVRFADARWIDVNDAFCRLVGYTREELQSTPWPEITHPEDIDLDLVPFRRMAAGEIDSYSVEKRFIHGRSGQTVWARLTLSMVRDDAGRPDYEIAIIEDITPRKQAEEALRESEERFRSMADNIAQFAWMADPTGSIFWYNRRWYEYTGTTLEEMQGWGWQKVHHPDHVERVVAHFKDRLESGELWEDTFPLRGKDGQYRWFLSRAVPIRDEHGRVVRWFGTNTDVTERLQIEERLREALSDARRSRSQLEAVFQAMQDGVVVFDMQGGVVLLNDAVSRIPAFAGAAGRLKTIEESGLEYEFRRLDGSIVPIEEWPASRAVRGERFEEWHLRGRRLDSGDEWVFSFSGQPAYDADGTQVLAVLVIRDITERKRAEEQLLQAQKLEGIGLLAGGIAHDFNNLLAGIMGYASMLQDDVPPESAEKVQAIVDASERAANLTRQLLAYAGKGRFIVQRIDLSKAVREMTELLHSSIPRKVRLAEDLAAGLPPVEADPGQVQQIVMNLVLNAAEAIPENQPGKITIRTTVETVAEGNGGFDDLSRGPIAPGSYVCLEVSDTGTGMDEATKARVFDPFFTTKFTGRGLGLAAVGGVVRAHHGAVQINSKPGDGTTFRVYLPASGVRDERRRATGGRSATVLVADDEEIIRNLSRAALERSGYRVLTASDGREALRVLGDHPRSIDIVLLDILMPDMRGDEVADEMARMSPGVQIIVMSGYSETEAARLFAGKPVAGFLEKPFSVNRLIERIKAVLESRAFRQA